MLGLAELITNIIVGRMHQTSVICLNVLTAADDWRIPGAVTATMLLLAVSILMFMPR